MGNFFNRQIGVLQQGLNFHHHERGNPLPCRFSAHRFHHLRQVFRRRAHFAAVPLHAPLMFKILRNEPYELVENHIRAILRHLCIKLHALVEQVTDFKVEGACQRNHRFAQIPSGLFDTTVCAKCHNSQESTTAPRPTAY